MRRDAVFYKGVWLDPSSAAYGLLQSKKLKELDELLKACDLAKAKLEGRTSGNE